MHIELCLLGPGTHSFAPPPKFPGPCVLEAASCSLWAISEQSSAQSKGGTASNFTSLNCEHKIFLMPKSAFTSKTDLNLKEEKYGDYLIYEHILIHSCLPGTAGWSLGWCSFFTHPSWGIAGCPSWTGQWGLLQLCHQSPLRLWSPSSKSPGRAAIILAFFGWWHFLHSRGNFPQVTDAFSRYKDPLYLLG